MGATNSTTNLDLPQFTDNDRPSWRGDVNSAFLTLDDKIGEVYTFNSGINGRVGTLETQAVDTDNRVDELETFRERGTFIDPTAPFFGAVGDGIADDTAALQAAVNAGDVLLPQKTFKITSTITVPTGRTIQGVGSRTSVILVDTDITAFAWTGGALQTLRNFVLRSWFVGDRTNFDIDVINPTKPVFEDIEIDGAAGVTGNVGIRMRRDTGQPGNSFMPQLTRVWIRSGRLVCNSVSDGHFTDGYVWANNITGSAAIEMSNVSDGWTFSNVDVIPTIGDGAGFSFANCNNINIVGGYCDGSYVDIMTGHGIKATDSGRLFVTGTHFYNLGRSGVKLINTHGCQFGQIGFFQNNKLAANYPDIDLYSSTYNVFNGSSHNARVDRGAGLRGAVYHEDATSTNNLLDAAVIDGSIGQFYETPVYVGGESTRGFRCRPESTWPRNPGAPIIIVPPASSIAVATAAVAYPAAFQVIAHRFTVTIGAVYSLANVRIDVGSGNMQAAILKVTGSTYTRVANSGIIACTAGDKSIALGGGTYLAPGEYALAFWCDNTTMTCRYGSSTGMSATRMVAEWVADNAGIPAAGSIAWSGFKYMGGMSLT